ncbi:hypothetical protein ACSBR2_001802 [Camellia fascicularis]
MTKIIENRLYLKKKPFWFQYKKGSSMSEHLNDFNKILVDLLNLNVEVEDEDEDEDEDNVLLLLNSLPDEYKHLITTLLYGKEEIKFEDVSNTLVNNEYRKKDKKAHYQDTSGRALVVRGRLEKKKQSGRGSYKSSKKRSRSMSKELPTRRIPAIDECALCRKKGHWKVDCLKNNDNKTSIVSLA